MRTSHSSSTTFKHYMYKAAVMDRGPVTMRVRSWSLRYWKSREIMRFSNICKFFQNQHGSLFRKRLIQFLLGFDFSDLLNFQRLCQINTFTSRLAKVSLNSFSRNQNKEMKSSVLQVHCDKKFSELLVSNKSPVKMVLALQSESFICKIVEVIKFNGMGRRQIVLSINI